MTPPADSNRVTVAELGRRLDHMEDANKTAFIGLHRRLDELNYVHPETLDTKLLLEQAYRHAIEGRVKDLEVASDERAREAKSNRNLAITGLLFPVITAVAVALILYAIFGTS